MRESCRIIGAPILHSSNWRQMAVAIAKSKFGKDQKCFANAQGEQGEANDDDLAGRICSATTTITVNLAYANEHGSAGIWDGMMQDGLQASLLWVLWADLFKIELTLRGQDQKRRRAVEGGGGSTDS